MKVTVIFGSATFVMPQGAEVHPSGVSLLSGSVVEVPENQESTDLPMLEVEWFSVFGKVKIITDSGDEDIGDEGIGDENIGEEHTTQDADADEPPADPSPEPTPESAFEPAGDGSKSEALSHRPLADDPIRSTESFQNEQSFDTELLPIDDDAAGFEPVTNETVGAGVGFEDL